MNNIYNCSHHYLKPTLTFQETTCQELCEVLRVHIITKNMLYVLHIQKGSGRVKDLFLFEQHLLVVV